MIAAVLERLFAASQLPLPIARAVAYSAVVAGLSNDDMTRVVSVLTEGAMHGPAAARGMAAQFGG